MSLEQFFCSSRTRHTRFSRDWSSDVCSSDLSTTYGMRKDKIETNEYSELVFRFHARKGIGAVAYILILLAFCVAFGAIQGACFRSEERRVGKECRTRCAPAEYSGIRIPFTGY